MERMHTEQTREACPVCGDGIDNALTDSPNFVRCQSCQLIYRRIIAHPEPSEGWGTTYYSDARVIEYYERRRSGFQRMVSLVNGVRHQRGMWLDIGCGLGGMLEAAQEQGWEVAGIEPTHTVEVVRKRMPSALVVHGTVEDSLSEFRDVGVASFVDVLRYIDQPREVLAKVHEALTEGGWLFIREINADRRKKRRAAEERRTSVGSTFYLQEWSPGTLRKALELSGFTDVHTLPSPTFTETTGWERRSAMGLRAPLERAARLAAWPVSRLAHAISGGRVYLTPNFVALGRKRPRDQ
jgi:SAM-dependent methyltransferase